jgi:hypothetical protein
MQLINAKITEGFQLGNDEIWYSTYQNLITLKHLFKMKFLHCCRFRLVSIILNCFSDFLFQNSCLKFLSLKLSFLNYFNFEFHYELRKSSFVSFGIIVITFLLIREIVVMRTISIILDCFSLKCHFCKVL